MAFTDRGRSGAKVTQTADFPWGIVTQSPVDGMLHSPGGLRDADGNTAFGTTFELVARIAQTASGTTTANFASSDAPFKFRVLSGEIECLQDARGRTERSDGRCNINVLAGSTNTVSSQNVSEMRKGDKRALDINTLGNEVVAADGSLSCACVSVLPEIGTTTTWELLVKLQCLRVI